MLTVKETENTIAALATINGDLQNLTGRINNLTARLEEVHSRINANNKIAQANEADILTELHELNEVVKSSLVSNKQIEPALVNGQDGVYQRGNRQPPIPLKKELIPPEILMHDPYRDLSPLEKEIRERQNRYKEIVDVEIPRWIRYYKKAVENAKKAKTKVQLDAYKFHVDSNEYIVKRLQTERKEIETELRSLLSRAKV